MPLHDLTYQRFEGLRTSQLARSFAMARSSGLLLLKRRAFLLLLAASWIPVIVRGGQIFVARKFPDVFPFLSIDALLWQDFVSQQVFLPVLLVAIYTGAGAISSDFSSGAFVVYLSKPISRSDYVIGKAIPVMSALLAVTLAPALTLLLVHVFLAEDFIILFEAAPLLPLSVIGYSVWTCLYFTVAVLAVSSLSRSPRVAEAGFGALSLGGPIFLEALSRFGIADPPAFLSMIHTTVDSGHVFFGNTSTGNTPFTSLLAMALAMAVSVAILRWRLRSAEVSS